MQHPFRTLCIGLALLIASPPVAALSPITRVVEILQDLSKKIEADGKTEEELYNKFVCWAKNVMSQKAQSNSEASSRADQLAAYIQDLQSGRIELSTERVDLTKDMEEIRGDIEVATATREQEAKDFAGAKDEMEKAIGALTAAIKVLGDATKDHQDGVLFELKERAGVGFQEQVREGATLAAAVELGNKVLSKGDALFLQRLLTGDVPTKDEKDWKKLNRKATFKHDYKGRSFKIQGVLVKLLEDFETQLKEAGGKETAAIETHDVLMKTKEEQKDLTAEALANMDAEGGLRGLSLEESEKEEGDLRDQIKADEEITLQVEKQLADKKLEWKERSTIRSDELAAISKAISVLHSDDNRDLFKKSFASQGFLFLQESATVASQKRSAAQVLVEASRQSKDSRLASVAARLQAGGHFDEVIGHIDTMIENLGSDEQKDLTTKENCEKNRAEDTRSAVLISRKMDDMTDSITSLQTKIQEMQAEIEEKLQKLADLKEAMEDATRLRADENKAFTIAKADDEQAKAVIVQAQEVLAGFYRQSLLQQRKIGAPVEAEAGKAPPPPPTTWDSAYGGEKDAGTGIISILSMILEDVQKDMDKATKEEMAAQKLFDDTMNGMLMEVAKLQDSVDELNGRVGEAQTTIAEHSDLRNTKNSELKNVRKGISDAEPGCDYFAINYQLRVNNRQTELDGLHKAKAILSGGEFTAPKDPNREMKPGDAFVQHRLRARKFLRSKV